MTALPEPAAPAARTVVITGGSRGIGAATALRAAQAGFDVAVGFRSDAAAAGAVVAAVRSAGRRAQAYALDVSREADVIGFFDAVDAAFGIPWALVNSAGIVDLKCRVDALSLERLERMFAVNVIGTVLCCREAVRRMSTRHAEGPYAVRGGGRGGSIVNVSSVASTLGSPGQYVDYAASKGAIDTFTLGLAREVAAEGVRVNAVRPGIIDTEIHASAGDAHRAQTAGAMIPMRRAGQAAEVAEAIVWLLSDAASYTTGAIVDVAGGR